MMKIYHHKLTDNCTLLLCCFPRFLSRLTRSSNCRQFTHALVIRTCHASAQVKETWCVSMLTNFSGEREACISGMNRCIGCDARKVALYHSKLQMKTRVSTLTKQAITSFNESCTATSYNNDRC